MKVTAESSAQQINVCLEIIKSIKRRRLDFLKFFGDVSLPF